MARVRCVLAIYLALILVVLPISSAWSAGPRSANHDAKGNLHSHGSMSAGHPWDDQTGDGKAQQPGGTGTTQVTKWQIQRPIVVPSLTTGGTRWVGEALIYLWQKATQARISQKAQYWR